MIFAEIYGLYATLLMEEWVVVGLLLALREGI